jgi:putative spermidine/putrescine transport system ATP-binding protein
MTYLQLRGIHKAFGQSVAVADFNLETPQGEFISFLGPSGCGKTTVLRMIAGFERPTSGTITLAGKDITGLPANKRNIGMVFQQYALFPNMTVADNIKFGLKVAGESATVMDERATEVLDLIHMAEFSNRYPHQLSGGQQQRVALARALAIRPQVLLLDEPLSALDAKIRVSLRQEIRAIQRRIGITTVFVTHDQEEALSISDRIVVMNRGRVEQLGTPREIYNQPATQFVASFIGTLNIFQARAADAQHIHIDGQAVRVSEAVTPGADLAVTIRPEAIQVQPADAIEAASLNGAGNHLMATVEDIYFLGSVVRIRTRLGQYFANVDTFNSPHMALPEVGDTVRLAFDADAVKVLRGDAAGG